MRVHGGEFEAHGRARPEYVSHNGLGHEHSGLSAHARCGGQAYRSAYPPSYEEQASRHEVAPSAEPAPHDDDIHRHHDEEARDGSGYGQEPVHGTGVETNECTIDQSPVRASARH